MKDFIPQISISEYNYNLPEDRIALYPTSKRNESKLLIYNPTTGILHHHFSELSNFIPEDSFLLVNNTKVISARIKSQKVSGGKAEILCVDPIKPSQDPIITMSAKNKCSWNCIIGGKKIKTGDILYPKFENKANFRAKIIEKEGNEALVEFLWDQDISFAELLNKFGDIPLPPYIKRETEETDKDRYQTVYASYDGSVAAPTAGLHFTDKVFTTLKTNGISINEILLHVGPGTFKPVESDNISEHKMHAEQIIINKEIIENALEFLNKNKRGKFIAVGTTSVRSIESLYWFGVKLICERERTGIDIDIEQWDPYYLTDKYNLPKSRESFEAVLELMNKNDMSFIRGFTELMIAPSYEFKIVDGLITNYHLPKSTLLLLVSAFIGKENLFHVYESALENDYRFLSYGDSSLLFK